MSVPTPTQTTTDGSPLRHTSLTVSTERSYAADGDDDTDSGSESPGTPALALTHAHLREPHSAHPSVVAVHGSVPSSPNLQTADRFARRAAPLTPLRTEAWDSGKRDGAELVEVPEAPEIEHEDEASLSRAELVRREEASIDSGAQKVANRIEEIMDGAQGKPNYRVIAVDFDVIFKLDHGACHKQHNEADGKDLPADELHSTRKLENGGSCGSVESERKVEAFSEVLLPVHAAPSVIPALRALKALGHPVHVVTWRPADERATVLSWLAQQGITVGLADDDLVAAVWYAGQPVPKDNRKGSTASAKVQVSDCVLGAGPRTQTEDQAREQTDGNKLKVLRAINAAVFISDFPQTCTAIGRADPPVACLFFGDVSWGANEMRSEPDAQLTSTVQNLSAGYKLSQDEALAQGVKRARTSSSFALCQRSPTLYTTTCSIRTLRQCELAAAQLKYLPVR
ncbi:hypothetical protein Q5752_003002 [Cryptotrichosporon argae]